MPITVTDIKTFITAPARCDLVVVKVETSEDGLYGYGCATFTQRALAVKTAVDEYLRPMMIGRNVANIEDAWQQMYGSSYWRNGPVLNNAISGVDMALWDIKGKMANMPVYDLIGGKCREGARIFPTAHGRTLEELGDRVQALLEQGHTHIRVGYGSFAPIPDSAKPDGAPKNGFYIDPKRSFDNTIEMFAYLRQRFGYKPEFMIDIHEKYTPTDSINLAKALEPYRLYFLEDSLQPENPEWFRRLRQQVATPLAMGELFNNVNEYKFLITEQLIDYMRCHISQLGGFTPALKLTAFCDAFAVKTIWHGPGDLSPFGMAAQLHLDLWAPNFALQELGAPYNDTIKEMFPGAPEVRGQYMYDSGKPGWGVDFDEEMAKKFPPIGYKNPGFMARLVDGSPVRS